MKLFERKDVRSTEEADTLYISYGSPWLAAGVDVGEGVTVRYDEEVRAREVAGLTIVGVGRRIEQHVRGSAMRVMYDPRTDTLSVILRDDAAVTENNEDKPGVVIDYDGNVVALEILDALRGGR